MSSVPVSRRFGGIFDVDAKRERLEEVNGLLEAPEVWGDQEKSQTLGKERQSLTHVVATFDEVSQGLDDVITLYEMALEEQDENALTDASAELEALEHKVAQLEFERMFSGAHDDSDCYLDVQSGSGGTEAQDWAEMVLRMYIKFGEKQ